MTCVALRTGDCADDVKQAIANKNISLATAGEHDADALCEQVLKDIRRLEGHKFLRLTCPSVFRAPVPWLSDCRGKE
jgi:hypothetical protein